MTSRLTEIKQICESARQANCEVEIHCDELDQMVELIETMREALEWCGEYEDDDHPAQEALAAFERLDKGEG